MLGPGAEFREGQREAIGAVIDDGRRALVVQRTGWGKSLVYWIATRVRRDAGHGPTLIISPLLSLMRNQIAMAQRLGIRAATIHSGNTAEWADVEARLAADAVDVLVGQLHVERRRRDAMQTPPQLGDDRWLGSCRQRGHRPGRRRDIGCRRGVLGRGHRRTLSRRRIFMGQGEVFGRRDSIIGKMLSRWARRPRRPRPTKAEGQSA